MITKEELDKLLPQIEQDRVEKTISTNDAKKFGEAICAFANDLPDHKQSGYLLVGVHDDGSRCGLQVTEKLLQTLMDFRTDGRIVPPPALAVAKFSYADGEVAVVEVQPHDLPPVRYKGKLCIRVGPRKGTANEAEERRLTEKRTAFARTFDVLPCKGSTLKDISVDLFKLRYLPSAIDADALAENNRELKDQLGSLKFYDLKEDCPSYAGILMFGSNPRYYVPGAYVQYVRFSGEDEASDFEYEHRFEGDLTTQLGVMEEFIKASIVKMVLPELGGSYVANYPLRALKELLFNAVIHKDYQSNAPIKFYEFSNRIEISNAGGLYGKARPENFPNENDYRNPALAEAVKNLGFVNGFNIGVKAAQAALEKNGNPEPEFIKDQPTSFLVKIYKRS
ncbi:MAG: putative DNA binding domain-containing protein [Lewinellaceae bacterium]|nr:putative DNA binding domain-containing protein [Lewinellaceae bacterium]MCB9290325.1 putative DNA binding domain-containing protein [Lewinellaceae bacterium]